MGRRRTVERRRVKKVEGAGMIEGIIDLLLIGLGIGCLVTGVALPIYAVILIALIVTGHVKVRVTKKPKEYFKVVGDKDDE